MSQRHPQSSGFHHPQYPYPSTIRGNCNRYVDYCTTDPKDHPDGVIYCDLNRPIIPYQPQRSYQPAPPPPSYKPFPTYAHAHAQRSYRMPHTQPQILHALLTARPPPPAFILPSPPTQFVGAGPMSMSSSPSYYFGTNNISPHSSVSSCPNLSPQSSNNLPLSDNENEENHSQRSSCYPPPEKKPKLSDAGICSSSTPTPPGSTSLCSTPELYIDESVYEHGGQSEDVKEEPQPCQDPSCQVGNAQAQNPRGVSFSPPPPMVMPSHKKFHYKTWAASGGLSRSGSEQSSSSYENHNQNHYGHGFESDGMPRMPQQKSYGDTEPQAHHSRAYFRAPEGQSQDHQEYGEARANRLKEMEAFKALFIAGERYRRQQLMVLERDRMTNAAALQDRGPVHVASNNANADAIQVKVEKEDHDCCGGSEWNDIKSRPATSTTVSDEIDTEHDKINGVSFNELFKEIEEFLDQREKMASESAIEDNGPLNLKVDEEIEDAEGDICGVKNFGGHVNVDALVELMACAVGDLEKSTSDGD